MAADNKTFYIEKDTNYALQVECATNINFDEIKRIAKFFVMQLPEAVQNKIYNELDRGVNIIDSEPQLNMYLHSFGNMHQAKMRQAFSNIGNDWFGNKEIEIIDYGCGQALATMLYHEYLQANGISQTVSKITLIEPSAKALCRAGLHAKAFFPDAEINTINKLLNDVLPTDVSHSDKPVLHLFSNIIDIEEVDLQHLATLAQAENEETDTLWVCISPFFGNHKDNRIPCFLDILNQPKTYTFQRSKGTWQNQWTINCIIAEQKTEEKLSTEVTNEEIANGIKDEYGCIYSPDGKRLLKGYRDIKSYTIKEGTKVICDRVFMSFYFFFYFSLKSIVIPNSVTKIGKNAFYNCKSLQSIVIPDSVTKIDDCAFKGCTSLQNIVIPNSVTKISKMSFPLGIELISHSNRFVVEDDLLIDLEEKRLIQCLKDKDTIVIPESVTKIGDNAFPDCESLQGIVIPKSVTEIGDGAFYGCKSLQSIVIPDSVTKIGSRPFRVGIKITSHSNRFVVKDDLLIALEEKRLIQCLKDKDTIVIPESVTKIGDGAFWGCSSLQSIVIPNSVTEIGDHAFYSCNSLQSIVIPDSATEIGGGAFQFCKSLQSIVITNSVTAIGNGAFGYCESLQSIVIPDSVNVIGNAAFWCCESLQSIVIPESVTSIGRNAFWGCGSLQSIVIPESVTSIGDGAFDGCKSLQSIVIPKGTKEQFEGVLNEYYHKFIKEIDYEKIYNGLGFCYEFGIGYKRNLEKAEEYYAKAKELENDNKVVNEKKDKYKYNNRYATNKKDVQINTEEKWHVRERRPFTQEEIDVVRDNVVVECDYGYSVCFFLVGGGKTYIPLSDNASVGMGEPVDMTKAQLVTLSKKGENDILRIEI